MKPVQTLFDVVCSKSESFWIEMVRGQQRKNGIKIELNLEIMFSEIRDNKSIEERGMINAS